MPLRAYLSFLALATLLPVAVFAAILAYVLVQQDRETFRRGAEARALAMITAVDTALAGDIGTLEALATTEWLDQDDLRAFRERAQRILPARPDWSTINLALPSGQQVVNLARPHGADLPNIAAYDPSWARAVERKRPFISDLVVGQTTGKWDYAVRVPVIRGGEVKYVLSAVVKPEAISALLSRQNLPSDWVAVVLDRSDRIVARTLDPQAALGRLASDSLREALARSPAGWFRGSTIEGVPVYTPYRRSETSGWAFAMGIPAQAVDAIAWRAAALFGISLLAAVALAFVLARIVGRRIAGPIGSLAIATEAVGRGEAIAMPARSDIAELSTLESAVRSAAGAQEGLKRAEEQMRSIVDHAIDGIITIDERGAIQSFNRAAEKLFAYQASEVIGRSVKILMPEQYHGGHDAGLASYLRTGEAKIIGIGREVEGRRKDGSIFPMDIAVSEFRAGGRRYFTGIVRDITARRQAELALKNADRAKDEFLATLSHELRNPLAALTTAAHLLRIAKDDAVASEARTVIDRQTAHMAHLLDDLLDISRLTVGKVTLEREPLDLAQAATATVRAWRLAGRATPDIAITLDTSPAWISADPSRIEQIVANLLDNALKFTPAGGSVTVSVRGHDGMAELRVSDTGRGIAPEMIERMFEPFVQGAGTKVGMGLGLALVKRLAELHGGSVSAQSAGQGRGATFTVRLPALDQQTGQSRLPAGPRKAQGARRVLLIEDNPDAREMLRRSLEIYGHEVRAASDGASGIAAAAETRPDIALVDVGLPDIDGYEVARRLRAGHASGQLRLIALTGYGQPADQRLAMEAGFDAHLTKPVPPDRLQQVIASL